MESKVPRVGIAIKLYGGNKEYKESGAGLTISGYNVELGKREKILGF